MPNGKACISTQRRKAEVSNLPKVHRETADHIDIMDIRTYRRGAGRDPFLRDERSKHLEKSGVISSVCPLVEFLSHFLLFPCTRFVFLSRTGYHVYCI